MNDVWVCAGCKSINRQRDSACYRCRAPQTGAMEAPGLDLRAESAAAIRAVRGYTPAWPLAAIASALILVVAVLGLYILVLQAGDYASVKAAFMARIAGETRGFDAALLLETARLALVSLLRLALALLALVVFAAWMALVTANVPTLGGGTPSRSPVRVFVYTLIPLWNLVKVPGILQDLLYRVDPRSGGANMVLAAWIGLVGSWFVSVLGSWAITAAGVRALSAAASVDDAVKVFGNVLDQSFWLGIVVEVMIATGAVLLVVIMVRIERRSDARDREIRAAAAAG